MQTIAIMGPDQPLDARFNLFFPSSVCVGAIQQTKLLGFQSFQLTVSQVTESFFDQVLQGKYCGLLFDTHEILQDERFHERILAVKNKSIPIVVHGSVPGRIGFDTVMPNHQAGCYDLTRLLAEKGFRRIQRCWCFQKTCMNLNPAGIHWLTHRNLGYEQAIRETNLDLLPALEIVFPLHKEPQFTKKAFEIRVEATLEYLRPVLSSSSPVDALMASNDLNSFEIAAACRKLGLKPNLDIPIVGYDNIWTKCFKREWEDFVPYATIDKQNEKIGAKMAEILIKRLKNKLGNNLVDFFIPPKLVVPCLDTWPA